MDNSAWIEAARDYSAMSESDRVAYWNTLSTEQRDMLRRALDAESVPPASSERGKRRGCGRTLKFGCLGFILGVVLVIGAEVSMFYMGVKAITTPSAYLSDPEPEDCKVQAFGPIDANEPAYTRPDVPEDCRQWIERHKQD